MSNNIVFIIASRMTIIRNWAKYYEFDLIKHPNIRYLTKRDQIRGTVRGGHYVILDQPAGMGILIEELEAREYTNLPADINQWPIELFS